VQYITQTLILPRPNWCNNHLVSGCCHWETHNLPQNPSTLVSPLPHENDSAQSPSYRQMHLTVMMCPQEIYCADWCSHSLPQAQTPECPHWRYCCRWECPSCWPHCPWVPMCLAAHQTDGCGVGGYAAWGEVEVAHYRVYHNCQTCDELWKGTREARCCKLSKTKLISMKKASLAVTNEQ